MSLPKATPEQLNAATPKELAEYAAPALDRIPRGFLPGAIFGPIRSRVRASTLDVVTFQAGTSGERVLVGQRGAEPGDRWWSGMQNIAGSVILPTEELEPMELRMADGRPVNIGVARVSQDITTPADRILAKEFGGSIRRTAPVRELMRYWVDVDDISENKITSWTEVALAAEYGEVIGGAFYDTDEIINNPPVNLVDGHEWFIEQAMLALRSAE